MRFRKSGRAWIARANALRASSNFLQLAEHEPDAVPRERLLRIHREHLPVRLERELEAAAPGEQQPEIEPRLHEARSSPRARRGTHRPPCRVRRRDTARRRGCCARSRSADRRRARDGSSPRLRRSRPSWCSATPRSFQSFGLLGPPRAGGRTARSPPSDRASSRCTSAIACSTSARSSSALERELVFAQRFGVVALLPEREAEVVVRERRPRRPPPSATTAARAAAARAPRTSRRCTGRSTDSPARARASDSAAIARLRRGARLLVASHVAVARSRAESARRDCRD